MKIGTDEKINHKDNITVRFENPWEDYADKKLKDYLQNNRHLIEPEVYLILDDKILSDIIKKIEIDIKDIFLHCYFNEEDIPNVKWITSFERRNECIKFDHRNTIILDFAQICDMTQVYLNCQLANEDMLAKYEFVRNEYAKLVGREIAFSESYDRVIEELIGVDGFSNTRITYALVNRNISDILFCNGYLDGAFHYCSRATFFFHKKPEAYIRPDSSFFISGYEKVYEMVFFRQASIFMAAHEAHHIELHKKLDNFTYDRRHHVPNGLFERIYNWLIVYGSNETSLLNDMWHRFGQLLEKRSRKIVDDLYEAFSGDSNGYRIIDECKDSILAWGSFDFNFDINKMDEVEYAFFIDSVSECYCDVMALFDLLDAENVENFSGICIAIGTILNVMVIQETRHIADELIGYMNGKENVIHSINILRLQLFFFAIINESMIDKLENRVKMKFHNEMNWSGFTEMEKMEPLMLGIFKTYAKDKTDSDFRDFYTQMFAGIDIIHQFYYQPTIYELFHVYKNGFICDECNSVYVKSEGIELTEKDYENGILVTNLSSIISLNNIDDVKAAGLFYLNKERKVDEHGKCIVDTASLSRIARIARMNQIVELFKNVRMTESKQLFDNLEMIQPYINEEGD